MLIYANYRENDGVDLIFFLASKEAYPIITQLEQITVKKAEAKVVNARKTNLGSLGTPLRSLKC